MGWKVQEVGQTREHRDSGVPQGLHSPDDLPGLQGDERRAGPECGDGEAERRDGYLFSKGSPKGALKGSGKRQELRSYLLVLRKEGTERCPQKKIAGAGKRRERVRRQLLQVWQGAQIERLQIRRDAFEVDEERVSGGCLDMASIETHWRSGTSVRGKSQASHWDSRGAETVGPTERPNKPERTKDSEVVCWLCEKKSHRAEGVQRRTIDG